MSNNKQKSLTLHQSFIFNPKYYKLFALGLFSFLCAYVVASTLTPVKSSDASTVVINNNTSDFFIQITSADSLGLDVTASPTGQMAIAKDTINVVTNSPNGYKLYVSTSVNDNNIYQGGSSSSASEGYFQPGSGTISSPAKLTQNTWGFALDSSTGDPFSANFANIDYYSTGNPSADSTWAEVPKYANSSNAKIAETSDYNSPDGTDLDIFYGINASTTLPTGSYSTEVTYTAISEGVNVFPTMQDFTSAQCDAMGTNTSINLSDSRDDKYYRVTKMADGHCWMTDNLALDGTDKAGNVRTLTPNDSNVTTNVTLAPNIIDGTVASSDAMQIFSGSTNGIVDDSYATTTQTATDGTKMPYGNLYNFMAATAGQGTASFEGSATTSICPKGWSLPQYGNDFSWPNLFGKYGLPTGVTVNASAIAAVQTAPFYIPMNSNYTHEENSISISIGLNGGEIANYTVNASSYGRFWMSIKPDSYYNYFIPYSEVSKATGESVRCIFTGQSDEIMQNFTATMCSNLAESTTAADNRKTMIDSRDGKFYKVSKLADGNCWMTSNLALDGNNGLGTVRTLTPQDSNVTTSHNLSANMADGTYTTNSANIYASHANNIDGEGTKYGNQYNYIAAHANAVDMNQLSNESICPKNWRLVSNADLDTLLPYYDLSTQYITGDESIILIQRIEQSPLYYPKAGYYSYGNSYNVAISANNLIDYSVARTIFSFGYYGGFYYFGVQPGASTTVGATSVRCVFGS
ncbi:hypothetical protein IKG54_01045 [Candidatus Saccharibacteria bacterium]|nr:hypothetical protein [Candidatus Saccharibacteria bacterium]